MKKTKLNERVEETANDTRAALESVLEELNQGQRQKLMKNEKVKALMERYGVLSFEC